MTQVYMEGVTLAPVLCMFRFGLWAAGQLTGHPAEAQSRCDSPQLSRGYVVATLSESYSFCQWDKFVKCALAHVITTLSTRQSSHCSDWYDTTRSSNKVFVWCRVSSQPVSPTRIIFVHDSLSLQPVTLFTRLHQSCWPAEMLFVNSFGSNAHAAPRLRGCVSSCASRYFSDGVSGTATPLGATSGSGIDSSSSS